MTSQKVDDTTANRSPLDDVMIAMDVVDTLRHDRALVDRELNDEARRKDLIDRLRKIYHDQGIEVPDHMLEDGVKALEEERFTYKAPDPASWSTWLAKVYVSRGQWGQYVLGGLGALLFLAFANYWFFERPAAQKKAAQIQALNVDIPARLRKLASDIASESADKRVGERAAAVAKSGLNAAASGDLKGARAAETELAAIVQDLRQDYEIRIVNRKGEMTGLWRLPPKSKRTYNFYLVVEAVGRNGQIVPLWITNEETSKRERVTKWAQRVDRSVLAKVEADKKDDGIIQQAVVGRKMRGKLKPDWSIDVRGGALTKW